MILLYFHKMSIDIYTYNILININVFTIIHPE